MGDQVRPAGLHVTLMACNSLCPCPALVMWLQMQHLLRGDMKCPIEPTPRPCSKRMRSSCMQRCGISWETAEEVLQVDSNRADATAGLRCSPELDQREESLLVYCLSLLVLRSAEASRHQTHYAIHPLAGMDSEPRTEALWPSICICLQHARALQRPTLQMPSKGIIPTWICLPADKGCCTMCNPTHNAGKESNVGNKLARTLVHALQGRYNALTSSTGGRHTANAGTVSQCSL